MKNNKHLPCPICYSKVTGRIDKRYCSIKCKNEHHNAARKMNKPMAYETNRKLMRNLTLLEGIMGAKGKFLHIHKAELIRRGFDPDVVTGFEIKGHAVRHICYHFSYTIDAQGVVHVRRHDKVGRVLPGFFERWEIDFPRENFKEASNLNGNNLNSMFGKPK